jgi:hypothetical protein
MKTRYQILINKFVIFLTLAFILSMPLGAHAQQPYDCGSLTADSPPQLHQIVCPVARVFNLLLFAAGVVLVVMLAYGGIKISSALGDPKGFEAGKQTLTYAIIGVACVLGVFVILNIVMSLLGINYGILDVFGNLQHAIQEVGIGLGLYSQL